MEDTGSTEVDLLFILPPMRSTILLAARISFGNVLTQKAKSNSWVTIGEIFYIT